MTEYRYYRDYTTHIINRYPSTAYPNHRGQPPENILVTGIDIRTLSYTFTTSSTYHLGGVSIIIPDDIITARTIIDNDRCMLVYRIYVIATDGVEGRGSLHIPIHVTTCAPPPSSVGVCGGREVEGLLCACT